jgi:hypothetical protein
MIGRNIKSLKRQVRRIIKHKKENKGINNKHKNL